MLTIMVHAKVKQEKLEEFLELAVRLTNETRGKHQGCISYSFNQNLESPTEFVLYEQWETQEDLEEHIRELVLLLGDPAPGFALPKKLLDMYESARPVCYSEIG
ncbi:MAG: antibiotic biosynthesis monooxygenase [Agarilytica sp.]